MRLGSWQEDMMSAMLREGGCHSAERQLEGKAKRYALRYKMSFSNLLAKMASQGYIIRREPGPHGGEWGARYFATQPAPACPPSQEKESSNEATQS